MVNLKTEKIITGLASKVGGDFKEFEGHFCLLMVIINEARRAFEKLSHEGNETSV